MTLGDREPAFIDANPGAAMITVGDDGVPKAARVAVGLIDGRLWSSGTRDRVRTRRLQRDPRCTLYVHEAGFGFLVLETTVTLLDGPDVVDDSIRLLSFAAAPSRRSAALDPTGEMEEAGVPPDDDRRGSAALRVRAAQGVRPVLTPRPPAASAGSSVRPEGDDGPVDRTRRGPVPIRWPGATRRPTPGGRRATIEQALEQRGDLAGLRLRGRRPSPRRCRGGARSTFAHRRSSPATWPV